MIWLESEAKTKWCPQSRVMVTSFEGPVGVSPPSHNRRVDATSIKDVGPCIASACMAWRWDRLEEVKEGGDHPHKWPDVAPCHSKDTERRFVRFGYCGLAGRP